MVSSPPSTYGADNISGNVTLGTTGGTIQGRTSITGNLYVSSFSGNIVVPGVQADNLPDNIKDYVNPSCANPPVPWKVNGAYANCAPPVTVTLTTSATAGGSVAAPGSGSFNYNQGEVVTLTASSLSGYHFVNWTGSAVTAGAVADPNSANTSITMDDDYSVTANFAANAPTISVSPTTLMPQTNVGSSPPNGTFTVRNFGGGTLSYSITDNVTWLACTPSAGTSTEETDTITVQYTTSGLAVGTYSATITVSDPNASNNPQTCIVNLTVLNPSSVWYVDASATGSQSGASWANAFRSLRSALLVAQTGHEIWVAAGTYMPDGGYTPVGGSHVSGDRDKTKSFQLVAGVPIYGGFAGGETQRDQRNPDINKTVLSGDLSGNDQVGFINYGENSYHVVQGGGTTIDGLIITGGNASGSSSPGAGVLAMEAGDLVIQRCSIRANRATYGGGLRLYNTNCTIEDSLIQGNFADNNGGGVYCSEYNASKSLTLNRSSILANTSPYASGILFYGVDVRLYRCVISGNSDTGTSGVTVECGGPGSESVWLDSCLLVANTGPQVFRSWDIEDLRIRNCTIAHNACSSGQSMQIGGTSNAVIQNSVLHSNSSACILFLFSPTQATIESCDFQGGTSGVQGTGVVTWGSGNINVDPSFRDPAVGDLRLLPTSPCVDAGNSSLVPVDRTTDLDGYPRIVAEKCEPPLEAKVNMGAYEGADVDHNKIADACEFLDCDGDGQNDRSEGFRQPRHDWDHDCDIDGVDFARWQYCFGRQEPQQSFWDQYLCVELDSNDDHIISMEDWDAFQASATGPGISYNPPPPFEITAWRSVREHNGTSMGIELDPALDAGNALIEPRQGTRQIIEVDLSRAANPVANPADLFIYSESSWPVPQSITFENGNQRAVIVLEGDLMLDQNCYTIDLSQAIKDSSNQGLDGDSDCAIRMLAGDVDGDATVETDDVTAITAANGDPADASNMRLDVNVDGIIDAADSGIAGGLLDNMVLCSGSGMMMAMGWANEGVGPTGGADALVGTFTLDLLREGQGPVSAAMVVHDTGATSVTLPAAGGTIAVDVVIGTDGPIWGFEGWPAVDAANVVSINAANWTERDNVLMSYGQPSAALTSYYDLTVMDWVWFATGPNGEEMMGSDIEPLLSQNPPVVMTLVDDLSALNGPISTPAAEWFTTSAILGGATRTPTGPGQTVLATLSLTISGTPGTYHLTLSDARFMNVAYIAVPMSAVQPLEIVVQGH